MKIFVRKIITLAIILSFSLVQISFAQTDTTTPPPAVTTPDTSAPSPDATTTTPDTTPTPPPTSPTTPVVQDTVNTQTTVSGTDLQSSTDPQSASSSVPDTSVLPVTTASSTATSTDSTTSATDIPVTGATATSTPLVDSTTTASTDVVGQSIDTNTPPPVDPTTPAPIPLVQSVPIAELAPKPQYAFAITGTTIPTKLQIKDSDGNVVQEQPILATLTPTVDNATGKVTVSGTCTDVYYVVLLFKNKTDYADDPSSYLVNRAYPCVNGSYTYSISDLPDNLTNGTYYLMVGQEGEKSPWQPITSLTEIQINKNP
jgi:hypothetical protein